MGTITRLRRITDILGTRLLGRFVEYVIHISFCLPALQYRNVVFDHFRLERIRKSISLRRYVEEIHSSQSLERSVPKVSF